MGSLKRFNLKKIIKEYNTKVLFETGTWKGDSVEYALNKGFTKILSTEIISEIAISASKRFSQYDKVKIINSPSTDGLELYLQELNEPVLFWLDAHYPGAEEGIKKYNDEENEIKRYPLKRELEIIARHKKKSENVILIDDLRIYEEGNFKNGNLPSSILPPKERNTIFIQNLYRDTHNIIRSNQDEGYILLLPKNKKIELTFFANFYYKIFNMFKKYVY